MRLVVREKGRSSLGYEITFSRDGEVCARGSMTVVCVTRDGPEGRMRSMPLPDEIAAAVEVAPQELRTKAKGG